MSCTQETFYSIIRKTPFGPFAIVWDRSAGRPEIIRIILSRPGLSAATAVKRQYPYARLAASSIINAAARTITALVNGRNVKLPINILRLSLCPPFQQKVLRAESQVPRGMTNTYASLAKQIGLPRAARAVGTALAKNPFPIIIPCHRTIRSDGTAGEYQGGTAMKKKLLKMEAAD